MAGGKSSRMQQDKALLPFGGYASLAEYQYERLTSYFDKIYISAKSNKFNFPVEIIEDCHLDSSPLVGMVSVFKTLALKEVFVLSVDAPFISIETIEELYSQAESKSVAIIAESSNGLEPLCGIYRVNILNKANDFIEEGNHRLQALLNSVVTQKVKIEREEEFMNLNHPFEYEEAKKLI